MKLLYSHHQFILWVTRSQARCDLFSFQIFLSFFVEAINLQIKFVSLQASIGKLAVIYD